MHNAGLAIVPKLGSNQDIPQWMDELWYNHTMEGDSASERKIILTCGTTQMNLKDIMLREKGQSQNDKCCMILLIRGI